MRIHVIAAMSKNRGIGLEGKIPWRCRKDMKYFKKLTIGKGNNAVLMGRKTWDNLPMPLQKRTNIVVSSKMRKLENAIVCNSIVTAKQYCKEREFDELWVIGGQNIYEQSYFLKPDSYYITIIDKHIKCDTFMPNIPKEYTLEETILDQFKEPGDTKYTLLYFNHYTKKNPIRETTLLSTGSIDYIQNT
jgi:dihydrofolate reductase